MKDLIKALEILSKYDNSNYPTGCEHDVLYVYTDPNLVSTEDIEQLETLGFYTDDECFYSYRFGSA